jgi:hypothetical protein
MKCKLLLSFAALALFHLPLVAQVPEDHPDVNAQVRDVEHDGAFDADVAVDTNDRDGAFDADVNVDTKDEALRANDDAARIDSDRDTLPRTASPLPLMALLGAASLVSAFGLRLGRS